jgi:hypothetical protein
VLSGFSSLKLLRLPGIHCCLNFGEQTPWLAPLVKRQRRRDKPVNGGLLVEAALSWYVTRIVQAMPSIEGVYLAEEHDDPWDCRKRWKLDGWYRVEQKLLVDGGGKELAGTLSITPRALRDEML